MILFAPYNKTNAFISTPLLSQCVCFFFFTFSCPLFFFFLLKVASVRSTYEMHTSYFEQLLIIENSQLKVASLRAP